MAQDCKNGIAIIGGGPAGCVCAYFLQEYFNVTVFEKNSPLKTLLPTGGGRCNLAPAEYDFKELVKNYPRGEKFLYSIFSQFAVKETLDFVEKIGAKTYQQDDGRIFPISNSSADVRKKLLAALNVRFINEEIKNINKSGNKFKLFSEKSSYEVDIVILATGGHSSYKLAERLGHKIIPPKPSLIGLRTDKIFTSGLTLKNIQAKFGKISLNGDLLFTHQGISGPLAYKISSLKARDEFPYSITLSFVDKNLNLQELFDKNPHKTLKNLLSEFLPKSLVGEIIAQADMECSKINSEKRKEIYKSLTEFELVVTGTSTGGETVTAGGINLDEINPKTMMSKLVPQLYFCGEVVDIDGFCGGYNLLNCWATAYVAANSIINSYHSNV